jgi:hypothetical protein
MKTAKTWEEKDINAQEHKHITLLIWLQPFRTEIFSRKHFNATSP